LNTPACYEHESLQLTSLFSYLKENYGSFPASFIHSANQSALSGLETTALTDIYRTGKEKIDVSD